MTPLFHHPLTSAILRALQWDWTGIRQQCHDYEIHLELARYRPQTHR